MIRAALVTSDSDLETIRDYMPGNYAATEIDLGDGETAIAIFGFDNAGWTLDGYVIPRLASGLHHATDLVRR